MSEGCLRLGSRSISAVERSLIEEAVESLETAAFERRVTGAGGIAGRVAPTLGKVGVGFTALGKAGGVLLAVITEMWLCDSVGGFEADVTLSKEEEDVFDRFKSGESLLGLHPGEAASAKQGRSHGAAADGDRGVHSGRRCASTRRALGPTWGSGGSTRAFYEHFTNWGPSFRENEVPYDEKLIYAYVRGKYFKGVEDPIRLIKMMEFSE